MNDPKRRRSKGRRRLLIGAGVFLLLLLAVALAPSLILRTWGPSKVAEKLGHVLGAPVEIGRISGGWFSAIEVEGLRIGEAPGGAGEPLLVVPRVRILAGLKELVFDDGPIRVEVMKPSLSLNVTDGKASWDRLHIDGGAGSGSGAGRPIDVVLTDGAVWLPGETQSFALVGSVSVPATGRGIAGVATLEQPGSGKLTVRVEEPREGGLTLQLEQLDAPLEPWRGLSRALGGPDLAGHADSAKARLRIRDGGALEGGVTASLRNVFLDFSEGREKLPRAESLQLRAEGTWAQQRLDLSILAMEFARGRVDLQEPGWIALGDDGIAGHLRVKAEVGDLGSLPFSLAGLLPGGLEPGGRVVLDFDASGRVDAGEDRSWETWFEEVEASVSLELDRLRTPPAALSALNVRCKLAGGMLQIEDARAAVQDSVVHISGRLPLAREQTGAEIAWRTTGPLAVKQMIGDVTSLSVGVDGAGTVRRHADGFGVTSRFGLHDLSIVENEAPVRTYELSKGSLDVEARWNPAKGEISVGRLLLTGPDTRVNVTTGLVHLKASPPDLLASFEATAPAQVMKWIDREFPPTEGPVEVVGGDAMVPLEGDVLLGGRFTGSARVPALVLGGERFSGVSGDVVVTRRVVSLQKVEAAWVAGSVSADGAIGLAGSGEEGLRLDLAATEVPLPSAFRIAGLEDGAGAVDGLVTGTAAWRRGPTDGTVTLGLDIQDLSLRAGDKATFRWPQAKVEGVIRVADSGEVRVEGLQISGAPATLRVDEATYGAGTAKHLAVRCSLEAEGAWLSAAIGPLLPSGITLEGRTVCTFDGSASIDDLPGSVVGKITARQAELLGNGLVMNEVLLDGDLDRGLLRLRDLGVSLPEGRIALQGDFSFLEDIRRVPDDLRLVLTDVPRGVRTATNEAGEILGTLRMKISGLIQARSANGTTWDLGCDLVARDVVGAVRENGRMVDGPRIPEVKLAGQVTANDTFTSVVIRNLRAAGEGLELAAARMEVRADESGRSVNGDLALAATTQAITMLASGHDLSPLGLRSAVRLQTNGSVSLDATGTILLATAVSELRLAVESCELDGLQVRDLVVAGRLDHGELTLDLQTKALLGQGRIDLTREARIRLVGPQHRFSIGMRGMGVELQTYQGRGLALLNPLLVSKGTTPEHGLSCRFDLTVDLAGVYEDRAGWETSVNGGGYLKVSDGVMVGSTVIESLAARVPFAVPNLLNETVAAVTGDGGSPGDVLAGLTRAGIHFRTFDTPISVTGGTIRLRPDLRIASAELDVVVNGYATLGGDLSYDLKSDLIGRLRGKAITDLPGKIPLIGGILGKINPTRILNIIELGAHVTGNALHPKPDGTSAVEVTVHILQ